MKYRVKITQIFEGCVDIEANDEASAIAMADRRFNFHGEELPDMDDTERLQFSIDTEQ